MRSILFVFVVFFILPSSPVLSKDCNIKLKLTDTYQDLNSVLRCLQKRINESQPPKFTEKSSLKEPFNAQKVLQTQTAKNGFRLELKGCTNKSSKIICYMDVTSLEKDTWFHISLKSMAFDEFGKKHSLYSVSINNTKAKISSNQYYYYEFIAGLRIPTIITFSTNKNTPINKISSLRMIVANYSSPSYNLSNYRLSFRDISIMEEKK